MSSDPTSPEQPAAPAACEWQIEHSYLEAFEKFYKLDCRFGMTNTEAIAAFRKRLLAAAPSPAPVDETLETMRAEYASARDDGNMRLAAAHGWPPRPAPVPPNPELTEDSWNADQERKLTQLEHMWGALSVIAVGRTDGGRPLASETARQTARDCLVKCDLSWSNAPPVPPNPLAEENARTESPSAQEYEPAPDRIWLAHATYNIINLSEDGIEYVRADILAAERKKAIEECARFVRSHMNDRRQKIVGVVACELADAIESLAATEG